MIPVIPTTQENHSTVPATVSGEEMKQPTEQHSSQPSPAGISHGAKLVGILFLIFVAVAIFWGILSRASAASRLETHTDENAALPVKVMTPGTSTGTTQIQLPGNTQAFNDTRHLCPHERLSKTLVRGHRYPCKERPTAGRY